MDDALQIAAELRLCKARVERVLRWRLIYEDPALWSLLRWSFGFSVGRA